MKYYMDLKGGMNRRRTPDLGDNIISVLPKDTRVEGDELSADGKWLNVLLIDGVQTTEPTWIATYTTSGILVTNPPPPVYPDFVLELSFSSDSTITVTLPDGSLQTFPNGSVKISASNPTLQLA